MAANTTDNLIVEGNASTLNYRMQITSQTTAASTLTLNIVSTGNQQFTGTIAGQIINLGVANTFQTGQEWWLINDSTQNILVKDNAGTTLFVLTPSERVRTILKDNSTTTGVWIITAAVSTVAPAAGGLFIANYSSTANSNSNAFLNTFGVAASDSLPAVIPITGTISRVTIMLNGGIGTGTFEFRINTSIGTPAFTASITGTQTATLTVSQLVNANDTINCKIAAGATGIAKPLVNIYM